MRIVGIGVGGTVGTGVAGAGGTLASVVGGIVGGGVVGTVEAMVSATVAATVDVGGVVVVTTGATVSGVGVVPSVELEPQAERAASPASAVAKCLRLTTKTQHRHDVSTSPVGPDDVPGRPCPHPRFARIGGTYLDNDSHPL